MQLPKFTTQETRTLCEMIEKLEARVEALELNASVKMVRDTTETEPKKKGVANGNA